MVDYVETVEKATSVKRIGIIARPTQYGNGKADFDYQPVFSVFDIGTIHPPVPLDNTTVCLMQAFNFELLREQGQNSHYLGLVDSDGVLYTARDAIASGKVTTATRVKFVNRMLPKFVKGEGENKGHWDYSMFQNPPSNNHVHPIEFISRNSLPESSSVWSRVEAGEISLSDLGLPEGFKKGDPIPEDLKPILDYSTKFEPDDRYLSPKQAQELMGVSDHRFAFINGKTTAASNIMTDYAASRGFTREDGKVEYVVIPSAGSVTDVLGDAVCTWHEDRLTIFGIGISKQRIRDKVKQLNPGWVAEIKRAKKQAREEHVEDFRTLMDPDIKYVSPTPEFFQGLNRLLQAGTNQWVGKKVYDVYPWKQETLMNDLERAVGEFQEVAAA